ncbi:MAG: hypothetical protein M1840_008395 [Geoglossum simile]|nr:MAG: hypothetical protein M1840_008395 [Geoglossum simile]
MSLPMIFIAVLAAALPSLIQGTIARARANSPCVSIVQQTAPTFELRLSGGPVAFITFIPATGEDEIIRIETIQWTATPEWDPSAEATLTGSRPPSSTFLAASQTFDSPPAEAGGVNDFINVQGTATYNIPQVGPGSIELTGRLQRPPEDTSAQSCIGWLLSFSVDDSGTIFWDNGQVGFSPLNPFGFGCPTLQHVQGDHMLHDDKTEVVIQ